MERPAPTSRTLPLWPLPLLAALLPLLAAHLAWWLSVRAGLVPACNPYWDGCVSISRAARHGPGNPLFRLAMLPCATIQVLCWLAAAQWLRRDTGRPLRWLPWLGLLAGVSLGLYVAYLGTGSGVYRLLRAYGVILYFGCTCLALLAVLRALAHQRPRPPVYRQLLAVATGFMAIGLASVAAGYVAADPRTHDRWSNALEWQLGLWLTAMFAALAWDWWRRDLRAGLP
ncbi:MAG TPA: hypothetical protein VM619_06525 [Luteimonas sp.]|nr:hypothetical protein [Luteimonas sp.]